MNKAQFIKTLRERHGTAFTAAEAVDAVLDTLVREVAKGSGSVSITGFGTLEARKIPRRKGRNPQTGEALMLPATCRIRFRPGTGFQELVTGKRRMPRTGFSIKKAPKGSLMPEDGKS